MYMYNYKAINEHVFLFPPAVDLLFAREVLCAHQIRNIYAAIIQHVCLPDLMRIFVGSLSLNKHVSESEQACV